MDRNSGPRHRRSGAFPGFADVTIEMSRCPGGHAEDRRRLFAFSRSELTPPTLTIELNPEATDYIQHDVPNVDDFTDAFRALRFVLEDAEEKLDRRQIRQLWPLDFPKPSSTTLRRHL